MTYESCLRGFGGLAEQGPGTLSWLQAPLGRLCTRDGPAFCPISRFRDVSIYPYTRAPATGHCSKGIKAARTIAVLPIPDSLALFPQPFWLANRSPVSVSIGSHHGEALLNGGKLAAHRHLGLLCWLGLAIPSNWIVLSECTGSYLDLDHTCLPKQPSCYSFPKEGSSLVLASAHNLSGCCGGVPAREAAMDAGITPLNAALHDDLLRSIQDTVSCPNIWSLGAPSTISDVFHICITGDRTGEWFT